MKTHNLFALFFLIIKLSAFSQAVPALSPKAGDTTVPKPILSYQEVLAKVPVDLNRIKATKWTQVQKDIANAALKDALVTPALPAKFRIKVDEIANWSVMTVYSNVPNREGYPIRVFGQFSDISKLASLKKGDTIILEGTISRVMYENQWGADVLTITLVNCTFTK